jgi:cytoskeletal protein CcmA (bactofilin family)
MAQDERTLWSSLTRHFAAKKEVQIVLDRRQAERRQRVQPVEEERRIEDRRQPRNNDFGQVCGLLGEGMHLKGELSFGGTVRVDGHLEGSVVRGDVLIIGERGQVKAEIEVGILQVYGQVQGNITVRQRVELLGASRFTGTIRTPCLVISKGAIINGNIEMAKS